MTLKPLIVIADDYAISPGVSRGILELAEAGRISGTGSMVTMPHWPEAAVAMKPLAGRFSVGLHLTLTDQKPLGAMPRLAPEGRFPTIGALSRQANTGRLPIDEIAAEFDRQLDMFERHFGRQPDFIDGHQHCQQLPGIRTLVIEACTTRLAAHGTWLRDAWDGIGNQIARRSFEGAMVGWLGRGLHRDAQRRGIKTNRGFTGVYGFGKVEWGAELPRMLKGAGENTMLMVHPGHPDEELAAVDSWVGPREGEWASMMGEAFPRDLAQRGFRVATGAAFPG
ncbi:MAG TPA: ChbG/HpnK family deacetylase [Magnetospirillaceae bacterium]|jgi:hypothetical protein